MPRSWTVNGRFLSQNVTGVQRYAREILSALDALIESGDALARDLTLRVVMPRGSTLDEPLRRTEVIETRQSGGYGWEQLVLPLYVRGGLLSLGNIGPLAMRRQILCVHDTNVRDAPESYAWRYRASQRVIQAILTRVARRVTTVSQYSAGQMLHHGIRSDDPIAVIPNGHEHATRVTPQHSPKTREIAGPTTIVIIGTPAPHKNIRMILELAPRLAAAGLHLAVVGQADPRVYRALGAVGDTPGCCWLGRLSDGEMRALLEDSLCLAFPSLAEGFGLPPLEAMAIGCPVVVSDRASLPEVCADAALSASAVDPDAWFACFQLLSQDHALRRTMIGRGRARAAQYSWRHSARLYLRAMAAIDGVASAAEAEDGATASELPAL